MPDVASFVDGEERGVRSEEGNPVSDTGPTPHSSLLTPHPKVAIVAGEASGDLLGSLLINAVKQAGLAADFFGIAGPKVDAGTKHSKLDPSAFFGMIDQVIARHPQVRIVASTLREVHSTNRHDWSAVAWVEGKTFTAPTIALDVHDRIGGGDGFASGFFYGLLSGEDPQTALKLGWAHGALLTTFPGDTTMASLAEVRAFADGGSARVQR